MTTFLTFIPKLNQISYLNQRKKERENISLGCTYQIFQGGFRDIMWTGKFKTWNRIWNSNLEKEIRFTQNII